MIVVYPCITITPVLAPYTFPPHLVVPRDKYDQEILEHLDKVFIRIQGKPAILGNTVRASIKRALGLHGKPMKLPTIMYMLFPEECVTTYSYSIINARGKQSVVNIEAILPNCQGELYADSSLKNIVKKNIIIIIGGKRDMGFGRILVRMESPRGQ
ncbi:MAG: hypothetical protein DRP01_03260 [Archaeoglobales archaeon]|nr:MAG: hypothetical protein DRP01_03260 [Archaeoglobales archaeon]